MTEIKEPQPIYPGRETDAIKEITQKYQECKTDKEHNTDNTCTENI